LLAASCSTERRVVLSEHRAVLDRHIPRAQASQQIVDHTLVCPSGDFVACRSSRR
jgi:hypothetical protein